MSVKKIEMQRAKKRLATIWFLGGSVVFALVVAQSLFGKFDSKTSDAWSWFLPTILPTLSLIVAVLVADAQRKSNLPRQVDRFLFRLTAGTSGGYLILVLSTFLVEPLTESSILELMQMSNLWLGPAQGIVGALLAFFFVRQPAAEPAVSPTG